MPMMRLHQKALQLGDILFVVKEMLSGDTRTEATLRNCSVTIEEDRSDKERRNEGDNML